MTKKKEPVILQGNKPTDDPKKYGLKFDGGKARWDLVPFKELLQIIGMFGWLINDKHYKRMLQNFNEHEIYNYTMDSITRFIDDKDNYNDSLAVTGCLMFLLLRGKSYTLEELNRSRNFYRWDLFDINEIQKVVDVYSYGSRLYGDYNWQMVKKERYFSALLRHFKTVRTKERFDGESGFLHLHHAIWNILALLWIENNKK